MSSVEFLWHDHECYTVKLNGKTVGMLYKRQGRTWTMRPDLIDDPERAPFCGALKWKDNAGAN